MKQKSFLIKKKKPFPRETTYDTREEKTPLKEVFMPFHIEVNRDIENKFINNFRTKRNEIRSLFNTNVGFTETPINSHQSFKTFKRGIARALFGRTNILNGKLSFISQLFEREKVRKKTSKIDVGNLVLYDLQSQGKTTFENRIIEIKKMYFQRSKHFSVLDFNQKKPPKINLLSKSCKRPLNLKTIFSINSNHKHKHNNNNNINGNSNTHTHTNGFKNKSRNIMMKNNRGQEHLIGLSSDNLTESTKHYCETQGEQLGYQYSHFNTNTHSNTHFNNVNNEIRSTASPSKDNRSLFIHSPLNMSLKDLQLKQITLKKEIKSMSEEQEAIEKQLFSIVDQGRALRKENKKKIKLEKVTNIDFKKDIEAILDIKIKKNPKTVKAKDLLSEALESMHKNKCKDAIIKLSDGITKMNNDTALKFAESIVQDYYRRTQTGKFYIPKKKKYERIQLDMKLRNKVDENYNKLQRMTFYFDRTKSKLIDEEKMYEEQKLYLRTEKAV